MEWERKEKKRKGGGEEGGGEERNEKEWGKRGKERDGISLNEMRT